MPLLVDADLGLPLRLALRWVVYQRRFDVAENTLRADLYSLRSLYMWGDREFPGGIEARLAARGPLTFGELQSFDTFTREATAESSVSGGDNGAPVHAAAGRRALTAIAFLTWALVPASRNDRGAAPDDALHLKRQIRAVLGPTARLVGGATRIPPLPSGTDERIDQALAPRVGKEGGYVRPIQFRRGIPFRRPSRLRNWLMWTLMRDSGLRIGEVLTLQVDDVVEIGGEQCVRVVRRPDAKADTRKKRPQVKTLERVVPLSDRAFDALRAYRTERPPLGRRMGSPYLITAVSGRPLGSTAASNIVKRLQSVGLLPKECTWHSLRHTWAEEVANELFATGADQHLIMDKLRYLGGWSDRSQMPRYYAQLAIGADARKDLAIIQRGYAERIARATPDPQRRRS